MRLLLAVGNKPNKFPRLQVSTISYFSTNVYELPWLHLDIISCVMKFLGHHCIFTFVIFNYLLQPLNKFNKVFARHCFILFVTCHMSLRFEVFKKGFIVFKWHDFGLKLDWVNILYWNLSLWNIDILELRCGFENLTCCFQFVHNFVYLFMHLSCCLLNMYLSITNTMMESTTSTPHFINLNSLFDIKKTMSLNLKLKSLMPHTRHLIFR